MPHCPNSSQLEDVPELESQSHPLCEGIRLRDSLSLATSFLLLSVLSSTVVSP
jgi:hypothetical protein